MEILIHCLPAYFEDVLQEDKQSFEKDGKNYHFNYPKGNVVVTHSSIDPTLVQDVLLTVTPNKGYSLADVLSGNETNFEYIPGSDSDILLIKTKALAFFFSVLATQNGYPRFTPYNDDQVTCKSVCFLHPSRFWEKGILETEFNNKINSSEMSSHLHEYSYNLEMADVNFKDVPTKRNKGFHNVGFYFDSINASPKYYQPEMWTLMEQHEGFLSYDWKYSMECTAYVYNTRDHLIKADDWAVLNFDHQGKFIVVTKGTLTVLLKDKSRLTNAMKNKLDSKFFS